MKNQLFLMVSIIFLPSVVIRLVLYSHPLLNYTNLMLKMTSLDPQNCMKLTLILNWLALLTTSSKWAYCDPWGKDYIEGEHGRIQNLTKDSTVKPWMIPLYAKGIWPSRQQPKSARPLIKIILRLWYLLGLKFKIKCPPCQLQRHNEELTLWHGNVNRTWIFVKL